MISRFIQEQKRYSLKELSAVFNLPEDRTIVLLRKLKIYNLVKSVKACDAQRLMTELSEDDVEVADVGAGTDEYFYVFTFVGVVVAAGRIIKCYPKYISSTKEPVSEMKQVLKVLERYNSREQIVHMFTEADQTKTFNQLAVMLYLLSDYYEHGLYNNSQEIIESNGTGEILWEKTINDTFAMLSNNRSYYFDLQTRRRIQNEYDYFHRLHACILTQISKELETTDLPELFDIATVDLSDEQIGDFGDAQYILYQIEKELNVEFNTRKQNVLKTIYALISHSGSLADEECMALFGTNSFNLVWEEVCSEVLNNQLYATVGSLRLPILQKKYNHKTRLIDLIEKPTWAGNGFSHEATDTLVPDVVTIEITDSRSRFLIYDAKYYVARIEKNRPLTGQPGIESITKQYLYQLAYRNFLTDNGISDVNNCFLLPTENDCVQDKGMVYLPMMDEIGLQRINVRFLPARMMYEKYLAGGHVSSKELLL